MSLHPVHKKSDKSEGVLDCELSRGDRFKDVDKKRNKIIVVCVYWWDNWTKWATSFVDFWKTIKDTRSWSTRKDFSISSLINNTISFEVPKIGNKTVLPWLGWVVWQQLNFCSIGNDWIGRGWMSSQYHLRVDHWNRSDECYLPGMECQPI